MVDVVLPWVDGTDPDWQRVRDQFLEGASNNELRMASTGEPTFEVALALELALKHMPFIRRLYIVTFRPQQPPLDHLPPGLRQKVHVVHHDQFIPAEELPAFNSTAIEKHFHFIPGLAEHFIIVHDDNYVLKPTTVTDFFDPLPVLRSDVPVSNLLAFLQPHVPLQGMYHNALRHTERTLFEKKRRRFYVRNHAPCPVTKTLLADVVERYGDRMPVHKFRQAKDIFSINMALNFGLYKGQVMLRDESECRCHALPQSVPANTRFLCINALDHGNPQHRQRLLAILQTATAVP